MTRQQRITVLAELFEAMQTHGLTPWDLLAAQRLYLERRIAHDQAHHEDASILQRWRNLLAALPIPPREEN